MTKIRKFKLALRPKELQRRAKRAGLDLAAASLGDEAALAAFLERFQAALEPAVVYQSFGPEDALSGHAPMKGLGFSLGVATVGSGPARFAEGQDGAALAAARLAEEQAVDDAVAFVLSLLRQEAADEDCELSPVARIEEPAALEDVCGKLQSEKIGAALGESGRLAPSGSAAFAVSWIALPRSKRKKKPVKK